MKQLLFASCLIFGFAQGELFAAEGVERISKEVSSRVGPEIGGLGGGSGAEIPRLLGEPLTADSAVRIALLNNAALQSLFESWRVSRADFDKTRLPERPVFEASVRFPERDEPYDEVEFTVEQDFLSLALFPLKSGLAGAELHKAELLIAREALDFAFGVKTAFYEAQGEAAMLAMLKRVLEQSEAAVELAKRQFEAGNISELKFAAEQSVYQNTKAEYLRTQADLDEKSEELNRLLGFGGMNPPWSIKQELAEIPSDEPAYEKILPSAMLRRLDLLFARKNVEALKHELTLSRFGVLGSPEAGVSTEKDVEGERVTGPVLRAEIPLYDLGQTEISHADARLKEAEFSLKALENDARSEIRQKVNRLSSARDLAGIYKNSVIPIKEKIVSESLKHQNYMLIGNYELIRAKQEEILARREYIGILKEYWIARSDLEKATSSKLPVETAQHGENHG